MQITRIARQHWRGRETPKVTTTPAPVKPAPTPTTIPSVDKKLPEMSRREMASKLYVAAKAGDKDTARLLIAQGADVNGKDSKGGTPLHVAAMTGHREVVELLVGAGADVNVEDNDRNTPVYLAAFDGHRGIIEFLLSKGGRVNATDVHGWTPLHRAAYEGHADVVKLLIAKGADRNARDKRNGLTPLGFAETKGHTSIALLLRQSK